MRSSLFLCALCQRPFFIQNPNRIEHTQHGHAGVGEDGEPDVREAEEPEDHDRGFHSQGEDDVAPGDAAGLAGDVQGRGDGPFRNQKNPQQNGRGSGDRQGAGGAGRPGRGHGGQALHRPARGSRNHAPENGPKEKRSYLRIASAVLTST